MSGRTVIIRYARALYEVAARKQITETIFSDLRRINEILAQTAGVREYCLRPHANQVLEMEFVQTVFIPYISQTTADLLTISVRNRRLDLIPYICEAFKKIMDTESGTLEVVLESACEAEMNVSNSIETKMQRRTGKKIQLKNIVVPQILGGFRILWDNRMIDLSASGRLRKMRILLKAAL